jgi:drug/metabolite transporter (DMT)-like permease
MDWIILIALGTIWGASYLFIKVGGAEIPPLTFVAGRTSIASLALGIALFARRENLPPLHVRAWLPLLGMGIFNSVIPYSLITWGETEISSGLASILTGTMPIFTVLIAHFLTHDEKLTPNKSLGVIIGFVGVVILFLPALQSGLQLSFLGEVAVVVAALSYALASVIAHKFLHGTSHSATSFGQLLTASFVMIPLGLLVEHPFSLHPALAAIGSLITLALLGTAIAYLLYYWLIDHTGATRTSLVTYIIPVSGVILGALVLGERLDWTAFVGLLGIIAGVGLVTRQSNQPVGIPVGVEAE